MARDPVCGMDIDPELAEAMGADWAEYRGQVYYFCSPVCKKQFLGDPERYLRGEGRHLGHEGA
ncbi:MAG: YHS domain-containing protein [Clostridia bacterium]|nr:YHS domain-containing protein [Clostridia bacterium]